MLLTCSRKPNLGANPPFVLQWIFEVLHFCQGLPIILVGCKKDLRYDQKTIEELHKTSQKPVSPEQVSLGFRPDPVTCCCELFADDILHRRPRRFARRLVP